MGEARGDAAAAVVAAAAAEDMAATEEALERRESRRSGDGKESLRFGEEGERVAERAGEQDGERFHDCSPCSAMLEYEEEGMNSEVKGKRKIL